MASNVPAYLIEVFEEAIANNNYDLDDIIKKEKVKKNQLFEETGKGTYKLPLNKPTLLINFKKLIALFFEYM